MKNITEYVVNENVSKEQRERQNALNGVKYFLYGQNFESDLKKYLLPAISEAIESHKNEVSDDIKRLADEINKILN